MTVVLTVLDVQMGAGVLVQACWGAGVRVHRQPFSTCTAALLHGQHRQHDMRQKEIGTDAMAAVDAR